MRKVFLAIAMALPGLLLVPLAASAANAPAQIVDCSGAAPWCFSPNPIRVTAGSTVTCSAAVAFPTAGTFPYHCAIHPSMTGTVIVSAAAASSPPVRGLASGGGGPQLPIGAALLLLGVGLLAARGVRRHRPHRAGEGIDKLPHQ